MHILRTFERSACLAIRLNRGRYTMAFSVVFAPHQACCDMYKGRIQLFLIWLSPANGLVNTCVDEIQ